MYILHIPQGLKLYNRKIFQQFKFQVYINTIFYN
jgi:hypothetical protein